MLRVEQCRAVQQGVSVLFFHIKYQEAFVKNHGSSRICALICIGAVIFFVKICLILTYLTLVTRMRSVS